jgi:hypothetical protein
LPHDFVMRYYQYIKRFGQTTNGNWHFLFGAHDPDRKWWLHPAFDYAILEEALVGLNSSTLGYLGYKLPSHSALTRALGVDTPANFLRPSMDPINYLRRGLNQNATALSKRIQRKDFGTPHGPALVVSPRRLSDGPVFCQLSTDVLVSRPRPFQAPRVAQHGSLVNFTPARSVKVGRHSTRESQDLRETHAFAHRYRFDDGLAAQFGPVESYDTSPAYTGRVETPVPDSLPWPNPQQRIPGIRYEEIKLPAGNDDWMDAVARSFYSLDINQGINPHTAEPEPSDEMKLMYQNIEAMANHKLHSLYQLRDFNTTRTHANGILITTLRNECIENPQAAASNPHWGMLMRNEATEATHFNQYIADKIRGTMRIARRTLPEDYVARLEAARGKRELTFDNRWKRVGYGLPETPWIPLDDDYFLFRDTDGRIKIPKVPSPLNLEYGTRQVVVKNERGFVLVSAVDHPVGDMQIREILLSLLKLDAGFDAELAAAIIQTCLARWHLEHFKDSTAVHRPPNNELTNICSTAQSLLWADTKLAVFSTEAHSLLQYICSWIVRDRTANFKPVLEPKDSQVLSVTAQMSHQEREAALSRVIMMPPAKRIRTVSMIMTDAQGPAAHFLRDGRYMDEAMLFEYAAQDIASQARAEDPDTVVTTESVKAQLQEGTFDTSLYSSDIGPLAHLATRYHGSEESVLAEFRNMRNEVEARCRKRKGTES